MPGKTISSEKATLRGGFFNAYFQCLVLESSPLARSVADCLQWGLVGALLRSVRVYAQPQLMGWLILCVAV
jgi:hypothetical protein